MIENFTSYTESDPNDRLTVSASTITITDLTRNDNNTYIYDDKGTGYFSGDLEHLLEWTPGATSLYGQFAIWAIANDVEDYMQISGHENMVRLQVDADNNKNLQIQTVDNGTMGDYDRSVPLTKDTKYYLKILRSGSIGICYIYSDESRTTLVDTISVTFYTDSFRYIYGCQASYRGGQDRPCDGIVSNLDLGVVTGWSHKFNSISNISQISSIDLANILKVNSIA
ncbi:MAG: hypothetical protein ACTSPI_17800 [Candidatus Heimdallarchaeaceae archaeon]